MDGKRRPSVVVLAGPNGAGKSTVAPALLRGVLSVTEFVNADTIAQGLSGFAPQSSALEAGKIMIRRLRELARRREDFAFETTLAARSFSPWLGELRRQGYVVHIVFLWLPSEDFAVSRVADRVAMGGHDVPEATIRRRYRTGLRNLVDLYQPVCDEWQVFNNSRITGPQLIARGKGRSTTDIPAPETWAKVLKGCEDAKR